MQSWRMKRAKLSSIMAQLAVYIEAIEKYKKKKNLGAIQEEKEEAERKKKKRKKKKMTRWNKEKQLRVSARELGRLLGTLRVISLSATQIVDSPGLFMGPEGYNVRPCLKARRTISFDRKQNGVKCGKFIYIYTMQMLLMSLKSSGLLSTNYIGIVFQSIHICRYIIPIYTDIIELIISNNFI